MLLINEKAPLYSFFQLHALRNIAKTSSAVRVGSPARNEVIDRPIWNCKIINLATSQSTITSSLAEYLFQYIHTSTNHFLVVQFLHIFGVIRPTINRNKDWSIAYVEEQNIFAVFI